jgi:hypothetical protein
MLPDCLFVFHLWFLSRHRHRKGRVNKSKLLPTLFVCRLIRPRVLPCRLRHNLPALERLHLPQPLPQVGDQVVHIL